MQQKTLSPIHIPTMSKDIDEQVKLAHRVVDVVDRPNRKIWETMLRYNVDKSESSIGQVGLFARKKEEGKFQHSDYVNYKLDGYIYISMNVYSM